MDLLDYLPCIQMQFSQLYMLNVRFEKININHEKKIAKIS